MPENNLDSKFTRKKITLEVFEKLKIFAQVNPAQFRRLWLLFQYQMFRVSLDFQTADLLIKGWVKNNALGSRYPEYMYLSTRSQRLGKMHEVKQEEFISMFTEQTGTEGFDIFTFAATASLEDLLNANEGTLRFVDDIFFKVIKLPATVWQTIIKEDAEQLKNIYIPLPRQLDKYLARETPDNDESIPDLMSFFES